MPTGLHRALLIGNAEFPADPERLQPLPDVGGDVKQLRDALSYPDLGLFAEEHVRIVFDASRSEILAAMTAFFESAADGDTLLLFYRGHVTRGEHGDLVLCARDTVVDDPATGIAGAQIRRLAQSSRPGAVVFVLDGCHDPPGGVLSLASLEGEGRFVIAATADGLTTHLVEALGWSHDTDHDGLLSVADVFEHVQGAPPYVREHVRTAFDPAAAGSVVLARPVLILAAAAPVDPRATLSQLLGDAARQGIVPTGPVVAPGPDRVGTPAAVPRGKPPAAPPMEEGPLVGLPRKRSARFRLADVLTAAAVVAALAVAGRWLFGWFLVAGEAGPSWERDDVQCTVFAPPEAAPDSTIMVQVFAHLRQEAEDAYAIAQELDVDARRRVFRSLGVRVPPGSRLDFELRMPGLEVDDPVASLVWQRAPEAVQFGVRVPPDAPAGTVVGTVAISLDSAPVGHVKFTLKVADAAYAGDPEPQGDDAHRYRMAFISYSSKDRDEVLRRTQILSIVGIRYFQDVLTLEPGERFERSLELGIQECDLFLLFWSAAARDSEWVRKEVGLALGRKAGNDSAPPEIRPVIVEGPPVVAPWEELADLHFNDRCLYFMNRS